MLGGKCASELLGFLFLLVLTLISGNGEGEAQRRTNKVVRGLPSTPTARGNAPKQIRIFSNFCGGHSGRHVGNPFPVFHVVRVRKGRKRKSQGR